MMTTLLKSKHHFPLLMRIVEHVRAPLFRNGYSLVTSAALTSGLGMLYWVLAARNYDAEVIGINSALISAMIFLANLAQLNLTNALNRFIPQTGQEANRLILSSYLVSVLMAVGAGFVFVLGSAVWSPSLHALFQENRLLPLWFVGAVMAWCVFVLQDSSMTGLRQAMWVPLENFIFSVGKIILLLVFAGTLARLGLFASWTAAVLLLLVPVNLLIFGRLVPQHKRQARVGATQVRLAEIVRFAAGDYVATLFWTATTDLLPLLVVEVVSAEANAYFYLCWTIAYSLYLVSRNLGMSLIAEAAANEQKLFAYSYQILVNNGRIILLALLVLIPGAPLILRIFGPEYAAAGTGLLQLLCLSALPNIVTSLHMSVLRVQKRMKALLVLRLTLSALVIILSYLLMTRIGIIGVGIAWLVAQTAVAVFLLATELRPVWLPHVNPRLLSKMMAAPRFVFHTVSRKRQSIIVRQILESASLNRSAGFNARWVMSRLMHTEADMIVAVVTADGGETAVLKAATNATARQSLHKQAENIKRIKDNDDLGAWRCLLPSQLFQIETDTAVCLLEEKMPGILLQEMLQYGGKETAVLQQTIAAILPLHLYTSHQTIIDEPVLAEWVSAPCQLISSLPTRGEHPDFRENRIRQLSQALYKELLGKSVVTSWVHGDYAPGNILLSEKDLFVTGIIDWELAKNNTLPQIDLALLFITSRMQLTGKELGNIVADLYCANQWSPLENELLAQSYKVLDASPLDMKTLLLLTWLQHIQANLSKANRFRNNPLWIANNVDRILYLLAEELEA